jgi:serine-type D-Ala-D-Ala carboxypeptidase/endopeptidase (penicillin-binding protein 4)
MMEDKPMADDGAGSHRRRGRRPLSLVLGVLLIVVGVAVGGLAVYRSTSDDVAPSTIAAPPASASAARAASSPSASLPPATHLPTTSLVPALWQHAFAAATPLLTPLPLAATNAPTPAAVLTILSPLLADPALAGDDLAMVVSDAATGQQLFDHNGADAEAPASTAKLAVAVAALQVLGPDAHLTTRVVAGSTPHAVVLVGGGDPTLAGPKAIGPYSPGYPAPASLADLATQTATQLRARGIASVTVGYDASLFGGPSAGVGWKPIYYTEGDVAPVSALEVDEGRADLTKPARSLAPAAVAAADFAALLIANGITVTGSPTPAHAARRAITLGSVSSPPISGLVQRMLGRSDNDIAEALARQVAIAAGRQGTFTGGVQAVTTAVTALGVPPAALAMVDGSGLSPSDRVTPAALAQLVRLAVAPGHPQLASIAAALPVAAFSGTLGGRFTAAAAAGAGVVRAKTGTLDGVVSLAGYVAGASGETLVFAVIANKVKTTATVITEAALDRIAAGLATVGP